MGRNRSFDEAAVLSRAMQLFRRKGFAAVSIKDLEAETGLTSGSIYHAYGDKAGLFAAAFAQYNRDVVDGRLARHAPPEAGIEGLRALFNSLLDEPGGTSFGCLITNTAIEFGGGAEAVPAGVAEGLDRLRTAFIDRLAAARLPAGFDREKTAIRLFALYQGILVLVRAGWDRPALAALIASEFDGLVGPRPQSRQRNPP